MAASSAGLVTICSGPEEGYQARLAARWSTRHRSRRFRSGIQRKCRSAVCRALISYPVRMRPVDSRGAVRRGRPRWHQPSRTLRRNPASAVGRAGGESIALRSGDRGRPTPRSRSRVEPVGGLHFLGRYDDARRGRSVPWSLTWSGRRRLSREPRAPLGSSSRRRSKDAASASQSGARAGRFA